MRRGLSATNSLMEHRCENSHPSAGKKKKEKEKAWIKPGVRTGGQERGEERGGEIEEKSLLKCP